MLAVDSPLEGLPTVAPKVGGMRIQDMLAILVPVSVIMLLIVLWAVFIRKPKNEHGRTRVYKSAEEDFEELDDGTIRKKKRHKRRRRDHRTRNPTLAEAGGLPPMRPEDAPPPP